MIRHMVLFRFRADATSQDRASVLAGLARLSSLFPAMRSFGLGENVSRRDQTFSHVMTMEFDDQVQLESYLGSSIHDDFVVDHFKPNIEQRAIASYESAST